MIKRIVCLANSRKMSERCVAGIEVAGAESSTWIRPVSKRPNHELSKMDRLLSNGQEPRLLDIIDVSVQRPQPSSYQRENWLLESHRKWSFVKGFGWEHLARIVDKTDSLWPNGYHTRNGLNDHVPQPIAETLDSSLKLIHVDEMQLSIYKETIGETYRPNARGRFSFAGSDYSLKVTDPIVEAEFFARGVGEYTLPECYLTISLGEPFLQNCYKLIAAVISKP